MNDAPLKNMSWQRGEIKPEFIGNHAAAYIASQASASGVMPTTKPSALHLKQEALETLNGFLDHVLAKIISEARNTNLHALTRAVAKILHTALGVAAINEAHTELETYRDQENRDGRAFDYESSTPITEPDRDVNLASVWNEARIRCMIYSTVGEKEEADFDIDTQFQNNITPAVAIFLTAVIEFLGEYILLSSARFARERLGPNVKGQLVCEDVEQGIQAENVLCEIWQTFVISEDYKFGERQGLVHERSGLHSFDSSRRTSHSVYVPEEIVSVLPFETEQMQSKDEASDPQLQVDQVDMQPWHESQGSLDHEQHTNGLGITISGQVQPNEAIMSYNEFALQPTKPPSISQFSYMSEGPLTISKLDVDSSQLLSKDGHYISSDDHAELSQSGLPAMPPLEQFIEEEIENTQLSAQTTQSPNVSSINQDPLRSPIEGHMLGTPMDIGQVPQPGEASAKVQDMPVAKTLALVDVPLPENFLKMQEALNRSNNITPSSDRKSFLTKFTKESPGQAARIEATQRSSLWRSPSHIMKEELANETPPRTSFQSSSGSFTGGTRVNSREYGNLTQESYESSLLLWNARRNSALQRKADSLAQSQPVTAEAKASRSQTTRASFPDLTNIAKTTEPFVAPSIISNAWQKNLGIARGVSSGSTGLESGRLGSSQIRSNTVGLESDSVTRDVQSRDKNSGEEFFASRPTGPATGPVAANTSYNNSYKGNKQQESESNGVSLKKVNTVQSPQEEFDKILDSNETKKLSLTPKMADHFDHSGKGPRQLQARQATAPVYGGSEDLSSFLRNTGPEILQPQNIPKASQSPLLPEFDFGKAKAEPRNPVVSDTLGQTLDLAGFLRHSGPDQVSKGKEISTQFPTSTYKFQTSNTQNLQQDTRRRPSDTRSVKSRAESEESWDEALYGSIPEEFKKPQPEEHGESLVDFLRNVPPPTNSNHLPSSIQGKSTQTNQSQGQPLIAGPPYSSQNNKTIDSTQAHRENRERIGSRALPRPSSTALMHRKTETQTESLADFFRTTAPPGFSETTQPTPLDAQRVKNRRSFLNFGRKRPTAASIEPSMARAPHIKGPSHRPLMVNTNH